MSECLGEIEVLLEQEPLGEFFKTFFITISGFSGCQLLLFFKLIIM